MSWHGAASLRGADHKPSALTPPPQSPSSIGINCLRDFYQTYRAYEDLTLPKFDEIHTEEAHKFFQYASTAPPESYERLGKHVVSTISKYLKVLAKYKNLEKEVPTCRPPFRKAWLA